MIAPPLPCPPPKNKTKQKNSNFVDNSAHIYILLKKIQHQVNTFRDIGLLSEFSVGLVNQFQLLWC